MPRTYLDLGFKTTASSIPHQIALMTEDGERFLTYEQLDKRVDSLSIIIRWKMRMNPEISTELSPLISIISVRDIGMVVSILAVLNCGCGYTPIDPSFPEDRQAYIFSKSQSKYLIIDSDTYHHRMHVFGTRISELILIVINSHTGEWIQDTGYHIDSKKAKPEESFNIIKSLPLPSASPYVDESFYISQRAEDSIAYVLFTSGSTGVPKGVMVPHRGVVAQIDYFAKMLNVSFKDTILGLSTFCFDISVLEIFLALLHGVKLVITSSETQKDPYRILEIIRIHKVTIMQATPTTYDMLLTTGWTGDPSIQFLVGGEAFRPSLSPLISNSKSLRNVYGPTETTIWASSYLFSQSDVKLLTGPKGCLDVPIGRPLDQYTFYVVSVAETLETVDNICDMRSNAEPLSSSVNFPFRLAAAGEDGELFIGGVGVSKGYIGDSILTSKSFFPDPFGGEGWVYRTGDLVAQLPDGNFIFRKRLDDQVKINGFRIELMEVEVQISSCPLVQQAVVVVHQNQLIAYVKLEAMSTSQIGRESFEDTVRKIRDHAARTLTSYMVPRYVIPVDSFPINLNRKIDRKALSEKPIDMYRVNQTEQSESKATDRMEVQQYLGQTHTMTDHITDIMHSLRGYRPKPQASLATVGIDSLGAAVFLRTLANSLGGIRFSTSLLLQPEVTVESFASYVYEKVLQDSPQILSELGIERPAPRHSAEDAAVLEDFKGDGEHDRPTAADDWMGGTKYQSLLHGTTDLSNVTASTSADIFSTTILRNRKYIEGFRGVLSLIVLYSHFHGSKVTLNDDVWSAVTSVFVLVSGLTTSLQLRPTRLNPSHTETDLYKFWDAPYFLISRFMGLFPILWLTLLLYAPRWYYHDIYMLEHNSELVEQSSYIDIFGRRNVSADTESFCVAMYIFGLQTYFSVCHSIGPAEVYYTSIIWNCFLYYSFFRFLLDLLQRRMLLYFNSKNNSAKTPMNDIPTTSVETVSSEIGDGRSGFGSWARIVETLRKLLVLWSDNNLELPFIRPLAVIWLGAMMALFQLMKNDSHMFGYFIGGIVLACVVENLGRRLQYYQTTSHQSTALRHSSQRLIRSVMLQTFSKLLWAFVPDAISVGIAAILSIRPDTSYHLNAFYRCILIEALVMIQLTVVFLQPPATPTSVWRYLLESAPMNFLGYISYPMYLMQQLVLNFYFRVLFDDVSCHTFPIKRMDPNYGAMTDNSWIGEQAGWIQLLGVFLLIVICWCIQRYFQDKWMADFSARILCSYSLLR